MIASVPLAIALSTQDGLVPGTNSIDRYGFTVPHAPGLGVAPVRWGGIPVSTLSHLVV